MSDPLPFRGKMLFESKSQAQKVLSATKNNKIVLTSLMVIILGSLANIWNTQPVFYAHAYEESNSTIRNIKSPIFIEESQIFDIEDSKGGNMEVDSQLPKKFKLNGEMQNGQFAQRLYEIVGDAPIREMVPFISERDEVVAAFLVGIAKKESSFGSRSPIKDGKTCYNYWGYKGSAGRGTGMGYACFASAEEAVEIVGNRIETLVEKNRATPAKMVDTWKCGRSCAGDPGAPGWVSTVALYFDKIVGKNS